MPTVRNAMLCNAATAESTGLVSMLGAFLDTVSGVDRGVATRRPMWRPCLRTEGEVQTPRPGSRRDTLCRVGLDARGELLEIVVDVADTNHVVSVLGRPNRRRVRR